MTSAHLALQFSKEAKRILLSKPPFPWRPLLALSVIVTAVLLVVALPLLVGSCKP